MKLLIGLMCLSCSFISYGIEVTESQIAQSRMTQFPERFERKLKLPANEINNFLSELVPLERILLTKQWLVDLSTLQDPTLQQKKWVTALTASSERITIPNPDHPSLQLEIVNIAGQAKATLNIWQINSTKNDILQGWINGSMDWELMLDNLTKNEHAALIRLLEELTIEQVEVFSKEVIEPRLFEASLSNQIVSLVASKTKSISLMEHLFKQKADEFSYQTLRMLPHQFETDSAIQLMGTALKNKALSSQTMLMLASKYSEQPAAQSILLELLKDPRTQWLAAAAVSKIRDLNFRQKIISTFAQVDEPLARFVTLAAEESVQ